MSMNLVELFRFRLGLQLFSIVIMFGLKGDNGAMALIAKTTDRHMVESDQVFSRDTKDQINTMFH